MKRCDHCGGRLGLVCQRYYARRFCKRDCKQQYLERLRLRASGPSRRWWQEYLTGAPRQTA